MYVLSMVLSLISTFLHIPTAKHVSHFTLFYSDQCLSVGFIHINVNRTIPENQLGSATFVEEIANTLFTFSRRK